MDDEESQNSDQPPPKRQRVLACRRCRHRKQKCDELRPCTNCQKSGDECTPTEPAPRPHVESQYVKALEERIAELETLDPQQSLDHMRMSHPESQGDTYAGHPVARLVHHAPDEPHGNEGPAAPARQRPHRRASATGTDSSNALETASSPISISRSRIPSHPRESPRRSNLVAADDIDTGFDHLIFGLVASPSASQDDHSLIISEPSLTPQENGSMGRSYGQGLKADITPEIEELLLDTYRERAQAQYPFFLWDTFLSWYAYWKDRPPSQPGRPPWQGFFVNLVFATALVLLPLPRVGKSDAQAFYRYGVGLLPSVLAQPNSVLHVQAYLLLSMHALHRSSTGRILSLASTTMRCCVQQQFHLSETEPEPSSSVMRLENQTRRRCFWCAYKLDRLVMSSFDLPPSVPDAMVTAKLYNNIDDHDLLQVANETPSDRELPDSPVYTCVSSSLHILQCRRIQSEISAFTLRWDYAARFEQASDWRIRILAELESYKSRVQTFSDPQSKGYTSQRWLAMIYHYTLLMLYRPTKESVLGPAGDWSVQASSQACLMFRKTQIDRQIAQPWLGLLVQFQSGVTLLYCFWATPPEHRTENYDSPDVSDAIRACSNILAIMADRWPTADCLCDVFELLAREVSLVDRPSRPPTKLSERSIEAIREKLPQVRALVVHRSILRMIEEMITDKFPRSTEPLPRPPSVAGMLAPLHGSGVTASNSHRSSTPTPPTLLTFELPFSAPQMYDIDGMGVDVESLSTEGLLSFPGMFDYDAWQ
ncbi:hypothetical protein BJ170DRAFT_284912 [Xylariales sp. AK1849]|nr:hypothetical protein BJ170DRAFT_284912 [Xylariales sp. AK1849]